MIKECEICEKEFRTFPCQIMKGHGRVCSSKCRNKLNSQTMKGHIVSDETRIKIGEKSRGKKRSKETRVKMSKIAKEKGYGKWMIGRKQTDNWKKWRATMVGENHPNWSGGKNKCIDCKKELYGYTGTRCRSCNNKFYSGEKHGSWKGNEVGYNGLHDWIKKYLGNASKCSNKECSYPKIGCRGKIIEFPKRHEWANISKKYKRDLSDWISLCPSCHRLYDYGKINIDSFIN